LFNCRGLHQKFYQIERLKVDQRGALFAIVSKTPRDPYAIGGAAIFNWPSYLGLTPSRSFKRLEALREGDSRVFGAVGVVQAKTVLFQLVQALVYSGFLNKFYY